MKKILQDLSYAEAQALAESMGEKKFRAKQLYEGLTQGKKISGITSLPKSFKEKLLSEYEDECSSDLPLFPRTARKNIFSAWRTAISSKAC